MSAKLFTPVKIRSLEIKNRIFMSPMCQYSAQDGLPNDWHFVHYSTRAIGGVGLVIVEATGVVPEGRITSNDLGLWNEDQMESFKRLTHIISEQGAVPAIQLAHAGRKSQIKTGIVAPSALSFANDYSCPHELTSKEIDDIVVKFEQAAKRALEAGFKVVEIHMAHGYLLHEFLSPLSNKRHDEYGGSLENRMRLPLKLAKKLRDFWPQDLPVFVRVSASDWAPGGWTIEETVVLSDELKKRGIDLIDCSSGGLIPDARIPNTPGYQVPFSERIKKEAGIMTGAVGLITTAAQAEEVLSENKSDVIVLGRELLRNPYFPLYAAKNLGVDIVWPKQYERAKL